MKYTFVLLTCLFAVVATAQTKDKNLKGNVQLVMNRMTMVTLFDTTISKVTTKYDNDKRVLEEDYNYGPGYVLNHKVSYIYNNRGLMTNRITYRIGTQGNEQAMDTYEYDDMDRVVKMKSISVERTDSTRYWYQTDAAGNTNRYSKASYARDTSLQITNPRGNITELILKGTGLRIEYKYDENDNIVEETHTNSLDKKLNRRIATTYNIDKMPVEIKEYNATGKMVDESTMAYTGMDEQGNYLNTTCTRNGKLSYSISTEIIYKP